MYLLEFAGEDDRFAALEARRVATDVTRIGPGLATARGIDGVARLAFTRRAAELVGRTDASVSSARALLSAAAVDRSGTVAVRARDVRGTAGVDTRAVERALGRVLVDRGFAVDLEAPDHELRAVFADDPDSDGDGISGGGSDPAGPLGGDAAFGSSTFGSDDDTFPDRTDGVCALGWLAVEARRDFAPRPTDRPFFQPGSMDPPLARALVNLAGAAPGRLVLDPMCGTGGLLVEAGLVGADLLGTDAQAKMARGAGRNLAHYLGDRGVRHGTARADATRLPVPDGAADCVVFDAPYGRQSKIESRDVASLVEGALRESRRATGEGGRAVLVGDRPWSDAARDADWTVEATHGRRIHRSLVRHVHLLR
ncbi:TIGR01177 family methyltransferase [Halobacteriales archaeon QS_8_69_26]|nr:MAG: TIGR01177 family methyltransferase [Halobacteriales archaeon QS_8_69_26]